MEEVEEVMGVKVLHNFLKFKKKGGDTSVAVGEKDTVT